MSNLCKRIAKVKKPCARKRRQEQHRRCSKEYTYFKVLTRYGDEKIFESDRPITEVQAECVYGFLEARGIEK